MPIISTNARKIILASKSPRRIELLKKIVADFEVRVSHINEDYNTDDPVRFVTEISRRKASRIAEQIENGIIIGADSIVVRDGKILGKPKDKAAAIDMLNFLSDHIHQVFTGFTIIDKPGGKMVSDYDVTDVSFRKLTRWEIERYVDVAHPFDKAGSYGIQDESAVFVDKISGCFYNVMGLPLTKLYLSLISSFEL